MVRTKLNLVWAVEGQIAGWATKSKSLSSRSISQHSDCLAVVLDIRNLATRSLRHTPGLPDILLSLLELASVQ